MGEGHHVHGQLAQVCVQLARKVQGADDSTHEVPVGGHSQLEGAEADVIDGLVVDARGLIGVLHQLVDEQHGTVGLHYCV